ncbi:hypothetical protein HYPSUDRAFT_217822 [Hypholoma sublateritium FD-334 SS-4]|uniref:DUF6593 domain-containing protein n=1 Tax=Hypholoma sublateritium (strain FD-334 SS-4) TaxID=945553 RepID=A0A0D2NJT3_HYPSF|nr:hypothetical protein HYPSUDRAFT_217822 [Hypholoma sublateritium FD-334 SS-4]
MSMQLCLVNNNPISTLLITPDGDPLFSIETAPTPYGDISPYAPSVPRAKAPTSTTRIKRLERYHMSTGHTETEIGVIEYQGIGQGCLLQLSKDNRALVIPPHYDISRTIDSEENTDIDAKEEERIENSWEFSTSDSERLTWKMFAHTPVLLSSSNAIMPVARYGRAKVGIVSRSRRAFLEIFPAGLAIIDLIVVTFVAFMKQRILIDSAEPGPSNPSQAAHTSLSNLTAETTQSESVFEATQAHTFSTPPR